MTWVDFRQKCMQDMNLYNTGQVVGLDLVQKLAQIFFFFTLIHLFSNSGLQFTGISAFLNPHVVVKVLFSLI